MKPFDEFCRRYDLDPKEEKSWEAYEEYSRQLELLQSMTEDKDRNQPQRKDEP